MWACGIVMYQLLCKGKHPWYVKGDKGENSMRKLKEIEGGQVEWEFPE